MKDRFGDERQHHGKRLYGVISMGFKGSYSEPSLL